jgi:PqqD family protein of HPr-rel-A system
MMVDDDLVPRWRIPNGQRLLYEDFDDGIVMFDAQVGATHLLNASAAEALAIVQESPGLSAVAIHRRLLERLEIPDDVLPFAALEELLWRLEDLSLVAASAE